MRHEIDAVLLVPFRRSQLYAGALHAFDDHPRQTGRPRGANYECEELDEKQFNASAKKKTTAVS